MTQLPTLQFRRGLTAAIERAAQRVLDIRNLFPHMTLAQMYDPETMPDDLRAAHHQLDIAVDAAYGIPKRKRGNMTEAERVKFLFNLYERYTRHELRQKVEP